MVAATAAARGAAANSSFSSRVSFDRCPNCGTSALKSSPAVSDVTNSCTSASDSNPSSIKAAETAGAKPLAANHSPIGADCAGVSEEGLFEGITKIMRVFCF